jgi:hypothetical protein
LTTTCPDHIKKPLIEILKTGLAIIRLNADRGKFDTCSAEAYHLHNIPGMLGDYSPGALKYYLDIEVPEYLRTVGNQVPSVMKEAWEQLRGV